MSRARPQQFRKPLSLALAAGVLWSAFSGVIYFSANRDDMKTADAIVVLGARVGPGGQPSAALQGRIEHAVALFRVQRAPKIVFTGGKGDFGFVESVESQRYAQAMGVPESACLREEASTSTVENALETFKLFAPNRRPEVILVTDRFHMARAAFIFEQLGFVVHQSFADDWPPHVPWLVRGFWLLREAPAYVKSALQLWWLRRDAHRQN
jgi:uncharacterized SAM-binding protein YcdF (DUF218 family)